MSSIAGNIFLKGNKLIPVKLLFFAKSREIVGHKQAQIQLPIQTKGRYILKYIIHHYPDLEPLSKNVVLSLNEEYLEADSEVHLKAGDEIAVIPPISGG